MAYRSNVCAVIRDGNSVLICHRINYPKDSGWQFPQGGIDPSNDIIDELKRELLEEIGTDKIRVVKVLPKEYYYDFPDNVKKGKMAKYNGQRQKWILCEFLDKNQKIDFFSYHTPEFDDWAWIEPIKALEMVIDFKKNVYKSALVDMGLI